MKSRFFILGLWLAVLSQPAQAACTEMPHHTGFQLGLGVQTFLLGNQQDFELTAPGYSLTGGYSWGHNAVYLNVQYASSSNFSLASTEGYFRQILETPFMSLFGQVGGFLMSYATFTSAKHDIGGGLAAAGLIILFSDSVQFDFFLKGYLTNESFLAFGGMFLFRL